MIDKGIGILRKYWLYPVGAAVGGISGYLYWFYIGCASGTCPITASPVTSVIWGALMGSLIFSLFKKDKKNE